MKFKVGEIVKCTGQVDGNLYVSGQTGRIIGITQQLTECPYLVEFNKEIDGHSGNSDEFIGKYGYCWWVAERNIILVELEISKVYGIANFVNAVNQGIYK
jgi:hypothetical protein